MQWVERKGRDRQKEFNAKRKMKTIIILLVGMEYIIVTLGIVYGYGLLSCHEMTSARDGGLQIVIKTTAFWLWLKGISLFEVLFL